MNSVNKMKELYENKRDISNIQNTNPNRRYSSSIKDRVSVYEKQIKDLEQMRKDRNLFEISRKFGLQKFFNKDNSDNKFSSTPKNVDMTNFIKEVEDICQNYEKEIEYHKRKNSAIKRKTENGQEDLDNNSILEFDTEYIVTCSNCYSITKEIEDYKIKIKEKDELITKLREENEDLHKRFEDLNLHMDSMMTLLHAPLIDSATMTQENFTSNSNLELLKDNYDTTNYLSVYYSNNTKYLSNYNHNERNTMNLNKERIEEKENHSILISSDKDLKCGEINNILIEIIGESLYYEYTYGNSLDISDINKTLLSGNNLLTYINTIFLNESNTNISISYYHEYVQTIFVQIYLSWLKCKAANAMNNKKTEFNWMINVEDTTNEIVLMTVEEIFKLFCNLDRGGDKVHSPDHDIDRQKFFETAFDKRSYMKDKNIFSLRDEIQSSCRKKILSHEQKIKEDLFKIIRLCRNYIHAGKIVYRNRIIYDFSKLYSEIKSVYPQYSQNIANHNHTDLAKYKYINYNKLSYSPSQEDTFTIVNLLNIIKNHNDGIDSVNIIGNNNNNDEKEVVVIKNGIEIDLASPNSSNSMPINIILIHIVCNSNLLKRITSLTVNNLKLNNNDISYLNCLIEFAKNLKTLNLNNNSLEDNGLRIISDILKINKSINSLYLTDNNITLNGAFYIADTLLKNDSLNYLYLSNNNITGMGLQSLINIIINGNKSIKFLDLSNNRLTNNDIIIISNLIIKNCDFFEGIDLSKNLLDSDSVNTLGIALKTNVFMKSVYLNNIGLDEDSTPYFFQHLIEANIEEIYLNNNNLSEVGGVLFANVIKSNNSIKKISLKNTNINSSSLICICHALEIELTKAVYKLESINLECNQFDDDSIGTFVKTFVNYNKDRKNNLKHSYALNEIKFPRISFSNNYLTAKSKAIIKNSNFECLAII